MSRRIACVFAMLVIGFGGCDTAPAPHPEPEPTRPVGRPVSPDAELRIGWIQLQTDMPWPTTVEASAVSSWPSPGEPVRWTAHIQTEEWGPLTGVEYRWERCGQVIERGTVTVTRGHNQVDLTAPWDADCSSLRFDLLSHQGTVRHDALVVKPKGLSVHFFVDEKVYHWLPTSAAAKPFEQWARATIDAWNKTLERANGLIDRLRLDQVTVLPEGTLPPVDLRADLVWVFTDRIADTRFMRAGSPPDVVADQTIVLHELLHQRGIVDLYAYDVLHAASNGSDIRIRNPDGTLAAGSAAMPVVGGGSTQSLVFAEPRAGLLMASSYTQDARLSAHTVYGLNLLAERRTPRTVDAWNNPVNRFMPGDATDVGNAYTTHVPHTIRLQVVAPGGEALAYHAVDVFYDIGEGAYQDIYADKPTLTLTTDDTGTAVLSGALWDDPAWDKRAYSNTLILRVRAPGDTAWAYVFLPSYDLNLAYIRGEQRSADIRVVASLR